MPSSLRWARSTRSRSSTHSNQQTRIKRRVRRTLCFSKTEHMPDLVLGLFINRDECGHPLCSRSNTCATSSPGAWPPLSTFDTLRDLERSLSARAWGAWVTVWLSGRYYPSDSSGTAVPEAAPPSLALPCSSCAKPAALQARMSKAPSCPAAWHGLCSHRCYRGATTRPVSRMASAAVQGQSLSVLGGSVCEDAAYRALLRCPRFRS
jgi:hypothetical protein